MSPSCWSSKVHMLPEFRVISCCVSTFQTFFCPVQKHKKPGVEFHAFHFQAVSTEIFTTCFKCFFSFQRVRQKLWTPTRSKAAFRYSSEMTDFVSKKKSGLSFSSLQSCPSIVSLDLSLKTHGSPQYRIFVATHDMAIPSESSFHRIGRDWGDTHPSSYIFVHGMVQSR